MSVLDDIPMSQVTEQALHSDASFLHCGARFCGCQVSEGSGKIKKKYIDIKMLYSSVYKRWVTNFETGMSSVLSLDVRHFREKRKSINTLSIVLIEFDVNIRW